MKKRGSHKCLRCGKEAAYIEPCDYCEPKRMVCASCMKSSKTASKIDRKVICKDCWGKIPKRRAFKSA
ncbi:hypothetical protein COU36_02395 [Candidatus Micrarchaeota archaeon CG10_big_fil_rev_8_21_14_0_10_59_7]|nr:MAG: hypothetical protein COU36_02395 [Candidatus Micrarchaeota archaeon CG10_big_fil_rev_8_21_14_0_10_59_7]